MFSTQCKVTKRKIRTSTSGEKYTSEEESGKEEKLKKTESEPLLGKVQWRRKKMTIIYKMYSFHAKKLEIVAKLQVEKALKPF